MCLANYYNYYYFLQFVSHNNALCLRKKNYVCHVARTIYLIVFTGKPPSIDGDVVVREIYRSCDH